MARTRIRFTVRSSRSDHSSLFVCLLATVESRLLSWRADRCPRPPPTLVWAAEKPPGNPWATNMIEPIPPTAPDRAPGRPQLACSEHLTVRTSFVHDHPAVHDHRAPVTAQA